MSRLSSRHIVALTIAVSVLTGMGGTGGAKAAPLVGGESEKASGPGTLTGAIMALGNELGVPTGSLVGSTSKALPDSASGHLLGILSSLLICHKASQRALGGTSEEELIRLIRGEVSLEAVSAEDISSCARDLDHAVSSARIAFRQMTADDISGLDPIDIWPVLRFEPKSKSQRYRHDYALIVDLGGNDVYSNNAGGNLLDVVNGPAGSVARNQQPAEGCQNIPALVRGKCIVSASVVLDIGGNDTYGVMQRADEDETFVGLDGVVIHCTTERLIRRIVTVGASLAGAGILIDDGGNDTYTGKTISLGSSHVGGVGILRDYQSGNDSYLAIRSSQGFGLVGALGLLWDEGGNDYYGYYMPEGGVISDRSVCDDVPRNIQGVGSLSGTGVLDDRSGADFYSADALSQGYGTSGGFGMFWDAGGRDSYQGPNGRSNLMTVMPSTSSTGMFVDEDGGNTSSDSRQKKRN